MLVVGPNGVGKTNLLESLHVATQGFSPRTRQDAQLIRFGETAGRIAVEGTRDTSRLELSITLRQGQAKEARLNGARLPSAESLRREVSTLVFTPDRLAVVKGGPAARRAYFDRVLGRLFPARAGTPQDYAATLAQRNAALRRVHFGLAPAESLEPWTERIADARRSARRAAPRDARRARTGLRGARRRARAAGCPARLRRGAADRSRPRSAPRPRSRARDDGARAASRRRPDRERRSRPAPVRLAGRAAAGGALAAAGRGGAAADAAAPAARRRALGARPRPAAAFSRSASRAWGRR